jgi:hypothetical protein
VRYSLGDFSVLLGGEGALNQALGNPPFRAIAGIAWAPRSHDRDHDGVDDDHDECPELAEDRDGFEDGDGCPDWDNDDDGVPDTQDRCPGAKEDTDGFEDEDGCPDPDNDNDGIPDEDDACPNEAGPPSKDPKTNGCPNKDRETDGVPEATDQCPAQECPSPDEDGDTFADDVDKCPHEAETFNGKDDDDGCPDQGGAPLVVIDLQKPDRPTRFARPVKFGGHPGAPEVDTASIPILRALAREMNAHPGLIAAVGVRPAGTSTAAQQEAFGRAFAITAVLRSLMHRDGVAETVGFKAVEGQPGAVAAGFGVLLLGEP